MANFHIRLTWLSRTIILFDTKHLQESRHQLSTFWLINIGVGDGVVLFTFLIYFQLSNILIWNVTRAMSMLLHKLDCCFIYYIVFLFLAEMTVTAPKTWFTAIFPSHWAISVSKNFSTHFRLKRIWRRKCIKIWWNTVYEVIRYKVYTKETKQNKKKKC